MEYTLGLALEDYVPVILSIAGLWLIAQMIRQIRQDLGVMAITAVVLIASGGLLKASWKLIIASSGNDVVWMDNSLFIFLAPGFTLMAAALWTAQRHMAGKTVSGSPWQRPLLLITLFAVVAIIMATRGGRTWVFVLLGLTTLGNTAFLILLIRQAWQQNQCDYLRLYLVSTYCSFSCLVAWLVLTLKPSPLQWGEQITNTFSQGAFVYAAWQLTQVTKAKSAMGATV